MTDATPELRWCSSCRQDQPRTKFSPGTAWCNPCMWLQQRRRKAVDYDAELAAQSGGCAICGKPPTTRKRLCLDHDHHTDRFRGLLCDRCNRLLGQAGESIPLLCRVISYLEKPGREIAVPPLKNKRLSSMVFPVKISYREPVVPSPPRVIPSPGLGIRMYYGRRGHRWW